jgi:hypothetical protein
MRLWFRIAGVLLLAVVLLYASSINQPFVTAQIMSAANYATGTGTANAQTATYSPAVTALQTGLQLFWLPVAANTTTTPTFAPNGLTAKTITKVGGAALAASDLTTTAIAFAIYDGTDWELQNPQTTSATGCAPGGSSTDLLTDNGSGGCNSLTTIQASSAGVLTKYDNLSTVGLGVPVVGWQSVLTNSSATSPVTLATAPAAGDYEIHFGLDLHTTCTTGTGELQLTFGFTGNAARTVNSGGWPLTSTQTALGGTFSGVLPIHVVSGNVTYTPTLTTACTTGTATWDGDIWMVRAN